MHGVTQHRKCQLQFSFRPCSPLSTCMCSASAPVPHFVAPQLPWPQPPRSPPPFRSIPPSLLSGALTHHELESLLACIRDKIQQNYHCEHWELQIAAVRCYDCVFSSPSLLPYSSSLPLSLSHHHHCQYHHIVSVVAHVGVLGQGCYGACSPECCALHPSACCNCG